MIQKLIEKLIEELGISAPWKIAIYTALISIGPTAVATYFACDKIFFRERPDVTSRLSNEVQDLKEKNHEVVASLLDHQKTIEMYKTRQQQYSQEIDRLKPFEEVLPQCQAANADLGANNKRLTQENIALEAEIQKIKNALTSTSQELQNAQAALARNRQDLTNANSMCSRKAQISEIERTKNSVERKIAELNSDSFMLQFDTTLLQRAQLEKLSHEYQQRILQLQNCSN